MIKIVKPGGIKAIAAENIALRQQLITLSRQYKRSPKLTTSDRILFGFLSNLISPKRWNKIAILIKPATILKFHQALVNKKYQILFSRKTPRKPDRKGPFEDLVNLIIEMKTKNPSFGYLRIAMQIQNSFNINLDKGVVRRVLDKHFGPKKPIVACLIE